MNKNTSKNNELNTVLPLSVAQHQVWLDQKLHPDSPHLTTGGLGYINGALEIPLFELTVAKMVQQNDALRLLPLPEGKQQWVDSWQETLLEYQDFSAHQDPEQSITNWWNNTHPSAIPLDGIHKPWHIYLVKTREDRYCIAMKYHHIMIDGFSTALAMNTMSVIYTELARAKHKITSEPLPLPTMYADGKTQYRQYIEESNAYLQSKAINQDRKYWRGIFHSLPEPLLEKRPQHKADAGDTLPLANNYYHCISVDDYQLLQSFAKSHKATTYHLFIAAVSIYFARIYNKQEVVFGVPVLNRSGKKYKSTLGMFVVIMPLKVIVTADATPESLVEQIVASLRSSYRHSRYAASMLGQDLNMVAQGRDRFFDITLSFESTNYSAHYVYAPTSEPRHTFGEHARYPLAISICEFHKNEPSELVISGHEAYFSPAQTQQLGEQLQYLLLQMTQQARLNYQALSLVDANSAGLFGDKSTNKNTQLKPDQKPKQNQELDTVIARFEHQVQLQPQAPALFWLEAQQKLSLTYVELNQQANRLARYLVDARITVGQVVAVALPRLPQTIVAYLAIIKAKAAFLPLDPTQPTTRLQQQIRASRAQLVITENEMSALADDAAISHLSLADLIQVLANPQLETNNLPAAPQPSDLLYVLFTSGSTGTPKGVEVPHQALASRLAWLANEFDYQPADIWLQSIQLTFDPAQIEVFLPLTTGASVALAGAGKVMPSDLPQLTQDFAATSMILVPTSLRYFNQAADQHNFSLRVAICGGEVLPQATARQFIELTGAKLFNFYGPTEACIFATTQAVDENAEHEFVSIGKPVADTNIYILDNQHMPLPKGCVGEIAIAGGLANGYANRPDLTAQRFIQLSGLTEELVYCTGDTGLIDDQGQLQFIGRNDEQIKLRGQRIEPKEIELTLSTHSQVDSVAVKAIDDELHAWLVLNQTGKAKTTSDDSVPTALLNDINALSQVNLPAYMVPRHYHVLSSLPQQSSGKTDYGVLQPTVDNAARVITRANNPQPNHATTATQNRLLTIVKQVLNDPKIDSNSHFFQSGADSLASLNLVSEIHLQLGKKVPFSLLLANPTVASLAQAIDNIEPPRLVKLSVNQDKPTIFIAASGHGDALRFNNLATELGNDYSVYMLQPPNLNHFNGKVNTAKLGFAALAEQYSEQIKQHSADQPVIVAGFSIGGLAAIATAQALFSKTVDLEAKAEANVTGLILLDTTHPKLPKLTPKLWRVATKIVNRFGWQKRMLKGRSLGSLFNDQGLSLQVASLASFKGQAVDIPTTLIQSSKMAKWRGFWFSAWYRLFGSRLMVTTIAGDHSSIFLEANIKGLADAIRQSAAKMD